MCPPPVSVNSLGSSPSDPHRFTATHTDQYLNFSSHHSIHLKLGVIRTLLDRMHSVVTEDEDKKEKEEKITLHSAGVGTPVGR